MARILAVGVATLDIVTHVDLYPSEDEKTRASHRHLRRGGNATNLLVVLSQLGHAASWAGTVADDAEFAYIDSDLKHYEINSDHVVTNQNSATPTSYIWLSEATGTRTIVHYRDLREYTHDDFRQVPIQNYDWIHFEGRAVDETRQSLEYIHQHETRPRVSVEIEKPREAIEGLAAYADVIIYSDEYANAKGFDDGLTFVADQLERYPNAIIACSWGEKGGYACSHDHDAIHVPAYPVEQLVDTVGAGDTFNAGFIHGIASGSTVQSSLEVACSLAAKKCGQHGFAGLTG